MQKIKYFKRATFIVFLFFLLTISDAKAINFSQVLDFNIDSDYDIGARSSISATLVKTTSKLYFYIEKNWWDSQVYAKQNEILNNLENLSQEFDNKIYPVLTSAFGSEWKPGIDGDERITLLFHLMKPDVGGYFRTTDEYLKLQLPDSNEREMVYLPIAQIDSPQLKRFLAHEFVHLITFNQKDKIYGVSEETWLNEARAEYAPTLLGYDDIYDGSNLQKRVQYFLERPFDSVTEWLNKKYDYGSVNLFTQYLVDQYGVGILLDSLKLKSIGIQSINETLQRYNIKKDFSQIFTDWTIAIFLNDCSIKQEYCYFNKNLQSLKINPSLNFLPLVGKSSLSVTNVTKNWAGDWQKFIGGNGNLKLEFQGLAGLNFKVPYLVQDKDGKFSVNFLTLDKNQKGTITISNFGTQDKALVIIPSLQTKTSGFDGVEPTYPFTLIVTVSESGAAEEGAIKQLLDQIDFLQKEIAKVQAQINAILGRNPPSCSSITENLYYGMQNNAQVRCLQEFLKFQGTEIYPEGLVTGNFGNLTRLAVIRFQEKYASEILTPLGLSRGTGVVGPRTLTKINQLLTR